MKFGILELSFILLVVLKLTGVIYVSWLIVCIPLILMVVSFFMCLLLLIIVVCASCASDMKI